MAVLIVPLLLFAIWLPVWIFLKSITHIAFAEGVMVAYIAGMLLWGLCKWHPVYCILTAIAIILINYGLQRTKIGAIILSLAYTSIYCYIPYDLFTKGNGDKIWMWFLIVVVAIISLSLHAYNFTNRKEKQLAVSPETATYTSPN